MLFPASRAALCRAAVLTTGRTYAHVYASQIQRGQQFLFLKSASRTTTLRSNYFHTGSSLQKKKKEEEPAPTGNGEGEEDSSSSSSTKGDDKSESAVSSTSTSTSTSDPIPEGGGVGGSQAQTDDSIKMVYQGGEESESESESSQEQEPSPPIDFRKSIHESERPGPPLVKGYGVARAKKSQFTLGSFSLTGRTVVVTGGAQGLGVIIARGLAASGANVAIVDLKIAEARRQATYIIEEFKKQKFPDDKLPTITAHHVDVSDHEAVGACVTEVLDQHGKIDHLVTSAGFTENFEAINYPVDNMRRLWQVNVDGTYLFATNVARHLMERNARGSMVFIGSMSGAIVNVPQPQAPYNASKAAVRHLAASLAVEWAKSGIRVNCVSPGYMATSLTRKMISRKTSLGSQWLPRIPEGRMGAPEDLVGPVAFLLSDAAAYVTGADLRVDGGYTAI